MNELGEGTSLSPRGQNRSPVDGVADMPAMVQLHKERPICIMYLRKGSQNVAGRRARLGRDPIEK
jgi:hypothetical protein